MEAMPEAMPAATAIRGVLCSWSHNADGRWSASIRKLEVIIIVQYG